MKTIKNAKPTTGKSKQVSVASSNKTLVATTDKTKETIAPSRKPILALATVIATDKNTFAKIKTSDATSTNVTHAPATIARKLKTSFVSRKRNQKGKMQHPKSLNDQTPTATSVDGPSTQMPSLIAKSSNMVSYEMRICIVLIINYFINAISLFM